MSLLALQQEFGAWLRGGGDEAQAGLDRACEPGLRVYRNNYRSQLVSCLETSFPHTCAWIGEAAFHDAAMAHIEAMPPSSWTLDAYGCDFPSAFGAAYPDDPEIFELAWLEWAISEAFVGPDHPVVAPDAIANVDWDRVSLCFSPTLDLADARTNATLIWSALSENMAPPEAALLPNPGAVLVWRSDNVSRFRLIDLAEYNALLQAKAGMSFARLCEKSVEERGTDDGVAFAGMLLGRWISDGLISGLKDAA
jgi:hypothetical protein